MLTVSTPAVAILLCVLTMIGWGSWANTQKLSDRAGWNFSLFYWDYVLGVVLFAVALGALFANGPQGVVAVLRQASGHSLWLAVFSGLLFNAANVLLVVAIDLAGIAVAFPVGIGLALVIGTAVTYAGAPRGNPTLLAAGVACILLAMVLSALAHVRQRHRGEPAGGVASPAAGKLELRGPLFAVVAGALMGLFYPQLAASLSPDAAGGVVRAGTLSPFAALLMFALGLLLSNLIINTILMRVRGTTYRQLLSRPGVHVWGILGGMVWMFALTVNLLAAGVAGPAVSYGLGQGATLVAALWGVFIWKEFRGASRAVWLLVTAMLVAYPVGLLLIGAATFSH